MKVSATIHSRLNHHETEVQTNETSRQLGIPPKATGYGSSVNGGELLMLALATCFCNDIYREAAKRNMTVTGVDVTVTGEFGAEGEPGTNFTYTANVKADAAEEDIKALIQHTDRVAEIHNTLRKGIDITIS